MWHVCQQTLGAFNSAQQTLCHAPAPSMASCLLCHAQLCMYRAGLQTGACLRHVPCKPCGSHAMLPPDPPPSKLPYPLPPPLHSPPLHSTPSHLPRLAHQNLRPPSSSTTPATSIPRRTQWRGAPCPCAPPHHATPGQARHTQHAAVRRAPRPHAQRQRCNDVHGVRAPSMWAHTTHTNTHKTQTHTQTRGGDVGAEC